MLGGLLPLLIGGIGLLINSFSGNKSISNLEEAAQSDLNNNMALNNQIWDKQMDAANTAHQREVRDLISAGLNPGLAGSLGGASTPSNANPTGAVSRLFDAQLDGIKLDNDIKRLRRDTIYDLASYAGKFGDKVDAQTNKAIDSLITLFGGKSNK